MSKRSDAKLVRLTDAAIAEHIQQSLMTLEQMCMIYDAGRPYISLSMSTEILRILTDNAVSAKIRGTKTFYGAYSDINTRNINAQNSLVIMRIDNSVPKVDFIPRFQMQDYADRQMKFVEWWTREPIWVASCAQPDVPPGLLPLIKEEQIPFDKREKLTRRELVTITRNKLGAHLDYALPELLDELQRSEILGFAASCVRDDGEYNTWDGTLPVVTGPAAAMIRQINHELIKSYGT